MLSDNLKRGRLFIFVPMGLAVLLVQPDRARGSDADWSTLHRLAVRATDQDRAVAGEAVAQLRAAGPIGLSALIDANADLVQRHRIGLTESAPCDPGWPRVSAAIDAVAAQKDAWASGLYWYTDFDKAKAASKESGKPILSLRLLGTLDSEFSCANSRFFRTVLYANAEVSKTLVDRFILHWKSVRPVPRITIDFGDGRVIERTITGNSIHYVLDAEGRVIDGIPGLYGPKAFLREINEAADCARNQRVAGSLLLLQNWHATKRGEILNQWRGDLSRTGMISLIPLSSLDLSQSAIAVAPVIVSAPSIERIAVDHPAALAAARTTASKTAVEIPVVRAMSRPETMQDLEVPKGGAKIDAKVAPLEEKLEAVSDEKSWTKLAALHADESHLDDTSRALMAAKNPSALAAAQLAVSKRVVESPMVKIVRNFERSIAEDSVRNEYLFHRRIHAWLADDKLPDGKDATDVDCLNERVYADLFLTPSSDHWLGLVPADTYSALPNDGVCSRK